MGGWCKSKTQKLKENRANKLRKIEGKEPNIVLVDDIYIDGIQPVTPVNTLQTGLLYFCDFKYETLKDKKRNK